MIATFKTLEALATRLDRLEPGVDLVVSDGNIAGLFEVGAEHLTEKIAKGIREFAFEHACAFDWAEFTREPPKFAKEIEPGRFLA